MVEVALVKRHGLSLAEVRAMDAHERMAWFFASCKLDGLQVNWNPDLPEGLPRITAPK